MIPTPPNSAKADAMLAQLRMLAANVVAKDPNPGTSLWALARGIQDLDSHLSMGGTPPTAWTEGPDEPLADDQPAAVVITGNPVDGLVFYGPFPGDDGNAAGDWASANLPGAEWWTATVKAAD